eukprot:TRINITY_DN14373_c0_g1_i1.p1 TRINITY_DN14373_c0_g1~~TRINITY_DN14373_c0_g1_i1.p1  ORF type:complete len:116 (-),score=27.55 TRINITY_DN14373_c0_g1_i1:114-461(-)
MTVPIDIPGLFLAMQQLIGGVRGEIQEIGQVAKEAKEEAKSANEASIETKQGLMKVEGDCGSQGRLLPSPNGRFFARGNRTEQNNSNNSSSSSSSRSININNNSNSKQFLTGEAT